MTTTTKRRLYQVAYYLEQGFSIEVEARSPAHAEELVKARLEECQAPLPHSERVHYDDGIACVSRVTE